jgi:hypothetical protein
MISTFLYDETFLFPIELICVELGYLLASIAFEVIYFISVLFLINKNFF